MSNLTNAFKKHLGKEGKTRKEKLTVFSEIPQNFKASQF